MMVTQELIVQLKLVLTIALIMVSVKKESAYVKMDTEEKTVVLKLVETYAMVILN
jgi:hypothetical protein